MLKINFKIKDIITCIITALLLGVVICCLRLSSSPYYTDMIPLESAFFSARDGQIAFEQHHYTVLLLSSFLNILVFAPLIIKITMNDFKTAKAFLFIRSNNISKWYGIKIFQSFTFSFIAGLFYNCSIIICAAAMGYKTESTANALKYLFICIVASTLITFYIVSIIQILSFKISDYFATALIICIACVVLYTIHFAPLGLVEYNPLTLYFVSLQYTDIPNQQIFSFPIWLHYAVLLVLTICNLSVGKIILKKSDMI